MIDFLSRKFIKHSEDDYKLASIRGRYGIFSSVVSIILNVVMAAFKIFLGVITGSVAMMADGFNNLSDVASNVATLLGFIFSVKNPDKEHPFGHGRLEYLAGLSISVLILFVGTQTLWDAIGHIRVSEPVEFSWLAVLVLTISILLKYLMGKFNFTIGTRINSATLIAAGKDSRVDILATLATLFALFSSRWTELPVDGFLGAVVSFIILKTGYDIGKDTITALLGAPPDEDLMEELKVFTSSYDRIIGTHDIMIHDYGPGKKYLTMHVEVNKNEELVSIHEVIDKIERDIYKTFRLQATLHLDPVDLDDELTIKMKEKVAQIVRVMNHQYTIHDFRILHRETGAKLIFDVTIPADDLTSHHDLIALIDEKVKKYDPNFSTLIEIDHSYT